MLTECRGIEKNRKEEMVEILLFRGRLITLDFGSDMQGLVLHIIRILAYINTLDAT